MAYSTGQDPRAGDVRTLAQSQKDLQRDQERARKIRSRVSSSREERVRNIRSVHRKLTKQERYLRKLEAADQEYFRIAKMEDLRKSLRATERQKTRNKGAIAGRYGAYDEDAHETARYDRMDLDPGARARGGTFIENDPIVGEGGPGRFQKKARKSHTVRPEKVGDEGPVVIGCTWSVRGDGSWPGGGATFGPDQDAPTAREGERYQKPNHADKWDSWP